MDRDNLERLRAKYGGAAAGDVHNPDFRKVVEILFSGADRRAKPYEGVSTFLDAPLIADAPKKDDFGGVDIALIGVPMDLGVTNRPGARHGPRAVRQIERMGFPVFSTGMRPVDSLGRGRIVSYAEPVVCGGVLVNEGDVVFADIDGVVVIPRAVEDEAIRRAREKVAGENAMRARLLEGKTLREAFDEFGFL